MNVRLSLGLSFLVACGASTEPPAETAKKSRPADRTEVTMERSGVEGPTEPAASAPSAVPAPASTAAPSSNDPSDEPMIGGAQQEPAVEKAVAPIRPRLRACYKKALAAEPGIGGSATFDATIGKEGRVASARFVKRDGLSEDLVGCLLAAVKAMTFDTSRKSQIVSLSFGTPPAPMPASAADDAGAPKK